MSHAVPITPSPRGGTEHRSGASRYFHVMGEGWFVYTREGVHGPFLERQRANQYLDQLIGGGKRSSSHARVPSQFDDWR